MKNGVRKIIAIDDILVNPKNPRFEPVKNQTKAIEMMLVKKAKEIKNLAKDILEHGTNPSKNLIVIQSGRDKFLTLEGNRRIISLKLLNDPTKTKDSDFREFFSKLKDENSNIPKNVSCVVFENKEDANHWIELEHTGENNGVGVIRWDPEQQDRFSNIRSKSVMVYDFADENKINRKNVNDSSLDRLLSTPTVCTTIGISFSKEKLKVDTSKSKVYKNLKKVLTAMSKESFIVNDIYYSQDREKWINETLGISNKSSSTTKTNVTSTSKETSDDSKKSTDRKNLIPNKCNLVITPSKIKDIFLELKDDLILDGRKATPNAVGVLFRVFLETSIDHYILKKQIEVTYNTKLKEKINLVTKHMIDNDISTPKNMEYIRKTSTSGKEDILHIQYFHDYVHSSNIRPESGDLKTKWDNMQEFFEILWKNV